jgi:hypothetical protein
VVFNPACSSARSSCGCWLCSSASVSARSAVTCEVTWPSRSTSRCTSIRPSSGGSRRISNWLEPDCARAAMATARPAIGMAAVEAGAAMVAGADCAAAVATAKPKFGRPSADTLAAPLALCPLDAPVDDESVEGAAAGALACPVPLAAFASAGAGTAPSSLPCTSAGGCEPASVVFAAARAEAEAGLAAASSLLPAGACAPGASPAISCAGAPSWFGSTGTAVWARAFDGSPIAAGATSAAGAAGAAAGVSAGAGVCAVASALTMMTAATGCCVLAAGATAAPGRSSCHCRCSCHRGRRPMLSSSLTGWAVRPAAVRSGLRRWRWPADSGWRRCCRELECPAAMPRCPDRSRWLRR